jgi:hypothetical protein
MAAAAIAHMSFTEQGVAMLSSVLRSTRGVEVNIAIMRTFVQLRRLMDTNRDLARKIEALEKKYDEQFAVVFEAIKQLIAPPEPPRRRIGFQCLKNVCAISAISVTIGQESQSEVNSS